MAGQRKHKNKSALKTASQGRQTDQVTTSKKTVEEEERADHTSKLPDDILIGILALLQYKDAVQTASVSRRWERLVARLPNLTFSMSVLGYKTSRGQPSEPRVQSMRRTLRRRCRCSDADAVDTLQLDYRKDVPMECRHADEFMALGNARTLLLQVQCARGLSDEDVDDWSLVLLPATTELHLQPYWYAVRLPRIVHGASVRSLTLWGLTVLRQEFFLTELPSLEDLSITMCSMESPSSNPGWHLLPARFQASFTVYSSFRLHAPKLQVFDWRCAYADEVRVDAVGRLSDVTVEIAAGRMSKAYEEEIRFFSEERRDKLMTDILHGLMPGLRPVTSS